MYCSNIIMRFCVFVLFFFFFLGNRKVFFQKGLQTGSVFLFLFVVLGDGGEGEEEEEEDVYPLSEPGDRGEATEPLLVVLTEMGAAAGEEEPAGLSRVLMCAPR